MPAHFGFCRIDKIGGRYSQQGRFAGKFALEIVEIALANGGRGSQQADRTSLGHRGGGFGNALIGTVVMVGLAAAISVPFGVLAAVFLAAVGPESRLANTVRFCAKTLSGFPSILAGVFAFASVVLLTGTIEVIVIQHAELYDM